ncbi:MAG: transketolase [Propioniciclava sp.]
MLHSDETQTSRWRATRAAIQASEPQTKSRLLRQRANQTRHAIVTMIARAQQGHIGGDLSVTDILTTLYYAQLNLDPEHPADPARDRFILSKGHCAAALYATLASCGFFAEDALQTFMEAGSELNGHPNRLKTPGVETNTGPLGHGLPVGVGAALGARLTGRGFRVYVTIGDGELQEGSNWEAIMCAGHQQLSNLVAIVDRNRLQQGDRTESTNRLDPLADRLTSFGWEVRTVDGHDPQALLAAFQPSASGAPVGVIANTVKGKGVSFMEDGVAWHHKVPNDDQVGQALRELEESMR